ncbi:MarR family transcriptional regulator [Trinickia terrae]|uniref:MarR family transcriptional regulator n=1 Tax=Trinickia terrae TaxID=2571161 RepID=A0A4U1IF28_9BURK|nr:MarR family transcriptional regulator [Trinickia terrae]TKC92323.1 MarR family transcriptional regulator [Trinickia terrae]
MSSIPPLSDDSNDQADQSELLDLVGYNIRRSYIVIQALFDKEMEKHDLRQAEFSVLSVVKGNPGINQRTLAEALAVAPPNLATLLDRLEARGLLTRQRSTGDKRVQHVELTKEGARLYGRALKAAAAADDAAIEKLSEAERMQLRTLLRKIFIE